MPRSYVTNLSMTVKATAGADIVNVCNEAVDLAQRVGCNVQCKFNDVLLIAGPDSDRDGLVAAYHEECKSKLPYKIASAWR